MSKTPSSLFGNAAALFTILIWGTTFISTKVLLQSFLPIEILFFRFTIGYFALLAIHPHFIKSKNIKEELFFAAAGLSGVTIYFLFENIALTYTQATNVGIITAVAPFFTAVAAHFFLKGEKLTTSFFIGFVLAMCGVVLISLNGSATLQLSPKGDILALIACFMWAIYSVIMRKISDFGYNNTAVTRRIFFYGLIFMIPAIIVMDFHFEFERFKNPINLFNIIYLGLGASAACFGIWNWCVKILGAVKTSMFIYLVPVITTIFAYFILKEQITLAGLSGMLLTLAGLFISERKAHKSDILPHKKTSAL